MNGFIHHLEITVRLHFRNKLALLYGVLFPLIFLVAFSVLYRAEKVPLLRHMGELLTVSVLGGACFGLPTTMVSERERGVWRRYRSTPVRTEVLVISIVLARYMMLLCAGALQLGLALVMGTTMPTHLMDLWVVFSFVSFAFSGLGLVVATLADTVPAVQALGQCIFLPMLIIGGVAVQLASLPNWAQHVSAFFPGRYAVESLQACVTGAGIGSVPLDLLVLLVIGTAGCVTGMKLFRWDAQEHVGLRGNWRGLVAVLASWLFVGLLRECYASRSVAVGVSEIGNVRAADSVLAETQWMRISAKDVASLDYHVPSDAGVVAPFAPDDEEPSSDVQVQVDTVASRLTDWPPGADVNDVQRVRNLLSVAAVADVAQRPVESYLPLVVLRRLREIYPKDKLIKLLTWIAMHPGDGTVIDDISELGVGGAYAESSLVRERSYLYAIKFVARLTGRNRIGEARALYRLDGIAGGLQQSGYSGLKSERLVENGRVHWPMRLLVASSPGES